MNIDEASKYLADKWGNKTLEDFRIEALSEATGTVYEAARAEAGPRLMLIMCVTSRSQISTLERAFDFVDDGGGEDWSTMTLSEVLRRTVIGSGFTFECLRDAKYNRTAVVLCSAEPVSMQRLNFLFDLPK